MNVSQNAAFHQGLQCLLDKKRSPEKEILFNLEIITSDNSVVTMDCIKSEGRIHKCIKG